MLRKYLPFLTITLGIIFLYIIIPDYLRQQAKLPADVRMYKLERFLLRVWIFAPPTYVVAMAVYLPFFLRRRRRERAIRLGLCICGYDLRGSSTICPECGRAIPFARRRNPMSLHAKWTR